MEGLLLVVYIGSGGAIAWKRGTVKKSVNQCISVMVNFPAVLLGKMWSVTCHMSLNNKKETALLLRWGIETFSNNC